MENRIQLVDVEAEIQTKALLPIQTAQALQVTSKAELEDAGRIVRILKDLMDEINRVFEPIVAQAFKAHKAAKAAQNEHLKPLADAEASVRYRMNLFLSAQKAERERAEAERRKAEEHLRLQPAIYNPTSFVTDKTREQLGAEVGIDIAKLDSLRAGKLSVPIVAPPRLPDVPPPPKAAGISEQKEWKWKVVNASAIPPEYWMLDEALINLEVKRLKDKAGIPGIEVFSESRAVVKR